MQHADDVVGRFLPHRDPGVAALQHHGDDVLGVFAAVDHRHPCAVNHDVGDFEVLHRRMPPSMSRSFFTTAPSL
jgi:hypothetical protein